MQGWIAVLATSFVLVACGGESTPTTGDPPADAPQVATSPTPAPEAAEASSPPASTPEPGHEPAPEQGTAAPASEPGRAETPTLEERAASVETPAPSGRVVRRPSKETRAAKRAPAARPAKPEAGYDARSKEAEVIAATGEDG